MRVQDERLGQDGTEELCKKQIFSSTAALKDGSKALVSNIDSLWWNIPVAVGIGHHLFNLGKKSEVAAETPDQSRNRPSSRLRLHFSGTAFIGVRAWVRTCSVVQLFALSTLCEIAPPDS